MLDAKAGAGPFPDAEHMSPTLRAVPPRWSSEPTESGRVELLIENMEQCGVDGAVVVQTSFSTWDNEYVAAAALRYPTKLRSMGMVDPLDPVRQPPIAARHCHPTRTHRPHEVVRACLCSSCRR